MQGGSEPNSLKIMEKLREIKRIFNDGESIYTSNPTALHSNHQLSTDSQQSRLKKYLPDSVPRDNKEYDDPILITPMVQLRDNDHNVFKKQL